MTEFVEFVSGGNLMLMLLFTSFICLILGMGLPTTANYSVVSTLMAPVIVTLGAQNGCSAYGRICARKSQTVKSRN